MDFKSRKGLMGLSFARSLNSMCAETNVKARVL